MARSQALRLQTLPLSQISYRKLSDIGTINQEVLEEIKTSIELNMQLRNGHDGLLNPLHVCAENDPENPRMVLYHMVDSIDDPYYVMALNLLGCSTAPCYVHYDQSWEQVRLGVINVKLCQQELDVFQRGELILEKERILEQLGLCTRAGDNQFSLGLATDAAPATKKVTRKQLAAQNCMSDRTLRLYKQITSSITKPVQEAARTAGLGHAVRRLERLARVAPDLNQQVQTLRTSSETAKKADRKELTQQLKVAETELTKLQMAELKRIEEELREKEKPAVTSNVVPMTQKKKVLAAVPDAPKVALGEWWRLDTTGSLYCGSTSEGEFVDQAPKAHFALVPLLQLPSPETPWSYDWLANKAEIVAVVANYAAIYPFLRATQMPWKGTLQGWVGAGRRLEMCTDIFIFGHALDFIDPAESKPISASSWEVLTTDLLNLFTQTGDRVICPMLDDGTLLKVLSRSGRRAYCGSDSPQQCGQAIAAWQSQTQRQPKRLEPAEVAVG